MILIVALVKTAFYFFCLSLYKMVDIENIPDNYKTLNKSNNCDNNKKSRNAKICS